MSRRVLVIGHDESLCRILSDKVESPSFIGCTEEEAPTLLSEEAFECLVAAYEYASKDDWAFVKRCREEFYVPIIISGPPENDLSLSAYSEGAEEYLTSPVSATDLLYVLKKRFAKQAFLHRTQNGEEEAEGSSKLIIHGELMKQVFATVGRLANFSTTVLIVGESGTGKELVAKEIHRNSPRRHRPFVAINCGAIPENLMESELFGHRKGAFTDASRDKKGLFEEAHEGTLFLDEIGELPLHLQVKLLRALQEGQIRRVGDEQLLPVDVRVIAATLRDLEEDVKDGRFRDDLYYRLNVIALELPPLRERRDEIPILIQHFIKKHNKRLGLKIRRVAPEALELLTTYRWRGNVRELENCVERAMVLTESDSIDIESLPDSIKGTTPAAVTEIAGISLSDQNLSIKQKSRDLEINLIRRALQKTHGNRTHAAKILEISHRALLYKLKEYNLGEEIY